MTDTSHLHLRVVGDVDPFPSPSWRRLALRVFSVGFALLVVIFGGYEIVEHSMLRGASPSLIHKLHIARGMGSAFILAMWAFYATHAARQHAEAQLRRHIERLEVEVGDRTQEMVRSQSFTEALFDSLKERIIVVDAEGVVIKSNRVARSSAGCDLEGRRCSEIFSECGNVCSAAQAVTMGAPVGTPVIRPDPRTSRVWSVEAYPMQHAGTEGLVLEVARDVTDEKRLETLVRHQEKMASLGVLAAGIAHDIGNPLASISSELELLEGETDPHQLQDSLEVLRSHVTRIVRTLREMVDFARRREEKTRSVDVATAVRDALRLIRHDARVRHITLVEEIDEGLAPVLMVEDHLVLVVVNLVLNALDAMFETSGGTITVSAVAREGNIEVRVRDTGTGMSPDVLDRATEPLFTTKGKDGGTGLGLSVSQGTIQAAGGRLSIESEPGRGTEVTVTLPIDSKNHG